MIAITFLSNLSFASTSNDNPLPDDQSLCKKINSSLYTVFDYGLKKPAKAVVAGTNIGLGLAAGGIQDISQSIIGKDVSGVKLNLQGKRI